MLNDHNQMQGPSTSCLNEECDCGVDDIKERSAVLNKAVSEKMTSRQLRLGTFVKIN